MCNTQLDIIVLILACVASLITAVTACKYKQGEGAKINIGAVWADKRKVSIFCFELFLIMYSGQKVMTLL